MDCRCRAAPRAFLAAQKQRALPLPEAPFVPAAAWRGYFFGAL
jgi:hypothetical protein